MAGAAITAVEARELSWGEQRDRLRAMREAQSTDSPLIVALAEPLLASSASSLGDEVWAIYEQVCIAAMDCKVVALEETCYTALRTKFGPESVRLGILEGMQYEARGKWEMASNLYKELLEREDTNATIRKRQVAVYIGQGKLPAAIKAMNAYLEIFHVDSEAWMQLSQLYLKTNNFVGAQFCMEELILSNPYNHVFHQRYAEVLYTIGGQENLALALKYFAKAAKLNPENTRAAYGVMLAAEKLVKKSTGTLTPELSAKAQEMLKQLYKGKPNEALLEGLLKLVSDA